MTFIKRFLYVSLFMMVLSFSYVYAGISNLFEMDPAIITWKYYCDTTLTTNINYVSDAYTTFEFFIKFDTWAVTLSHDSINSYFDQDTLFNVVWDKYRARWWTLSTTTVDKEATTFTIQPILVAPYETSTLLEFVDNAWNTPAYDTTYTEDNISIWGGGKDTLAGVSNATINFDAYPCIDDNEEPFVYDFSPTTIDWGQLTWSNTISFTMIDWRGSAYWHYRYDNDAKTLGDYTTSPSNVDNQYGVDSSTISVSVDNNWSVTQPSLTTIAFAWDASHNALTWDREDRGYVVSFTSPVFNVEEEVKITITWADNQNYIWAIHTGSRTFTFNSPVPPTIDMLYPVDHSENHNPTISPLVFFAWDEWAGVDSWTISITIQDVYSGPTLVYTAHTYNYWDSELSIVLSGWTTIKGWSGGYKIELTPWINLPENSTINISWYAMDLVGNEILDAWWFTTRPSCAFYGCSEILDIYIMTWINLPWSPYSFTWSLLIATWTNPDSPYPYLMGVDNNILMCGFPWTWANLTGNIQIFEWDGETLLTTDYTQHKLYITWLNFEYENWVINILN